MIATGNIITLQYPLDYSASAAVTRTADIIFFPSM